MATEHDKRGGDMGSDNLEHYGVKGMRWGVRRSDAQLAKAAAKRESKGSGSTRYSEGPKKLSDDELGARIKRLEAEKRYKELNSRTVSKGEKIAVEVLTTVGKDTATKVLNGTAALATQVALNRQMKGLGDAVLPKQKTPKYLKEKVGSKRG